MSEETKAGLRELGFTVMPTIPVNAVYDQIKGHADIQIHIVNGRAICAPEVYEYYKKMLPEIDVICGSKPLGAKYPADIAYNVCGIGGLAICSERYAAPEILRQYKKILNTRQGYSKCSVCVVSDIAAITADEGIYSLLCKNGIDVLKIRPGFVSLDNMTGFIGGASGLLRDRLLAFNGDIATHPDCENIKAFCKNSGVDIISLGNGELCDIGSILAV